MNQNEIIKYLQADTRYSASIYACIRLLRRYLGTLILFAVVGLLVGIYLHSKQLPLYSSKISLLVQPQVANLAEVGEGYINERTYRYYQTQYRVMRSKQVLRRVVDNLGVVGGLNNYYYPAKPSFWQTVTEMVGYRDKAHPSTAGLSQSAQKLTFAKHNDAIAYIQAGLSLVSSNDTEFVELGFVSPSAEFSADVVNAVAQSYVEYLSDGKNVKVDRASTWLSGKLEEIDLQRKQAEQALALFRKLQGTFDTQGLEASATQELKALQEEVVLARLQVQQLKERYGSKHPSLIAARSDLANAKQNLLVGEKSVMDDRAKEFELARLETNLESTRKLYEMFLERYQEANVSTDTQLSDVTIVDRAEVNYKPTNISSYKQLTLSSFVSLALGVGFILLRFFFGNTFRSHREVEDTLGISVLSVVPMCTARGRHKNSKFSAYRDALYPVYTEAINRLRGNLLHSSKDSSTKVLQVTSAVEGEGKSTLAYNLALAFTEMGKKTLLIDADLRRPSIRGFIASTPQEHGLADWLSSTVTLDKVIKQHPIHDDLHVIIASHSVDRPAELISNGTLGKLIQSLRPAYDHIIFDTPPILPVIDSLEISRMMDSVIFTVESEKTPIPIVEQALDQLKQTTQANINAVLNKLSEDASEYYYPSNYYDYYANNRTSDYPDGEGELA